MSVLQVANLWFESTANNRLQYSSGANGFLFFAGGNQVATINTTGVTFSNSNLSASNVTITSNAFTIGTGFYFVSNGNFGIGNSAPNNTLSVNGTTYLGGAVTATGTITGNISGSAGSATNATYATSAGSATNASAATNATYATSAGSAGSATNATYATSAGSATNATYATSAGSATNATSASSATNATYATSSGSATNATYATSAANGKTLLNTLTASNSGSLSDTTSFTSTYKYYDIVYDGITFTQTGSPNNGFFRAQFYDGSSFISSGYSFSSWFNDTGSNGSYSSGNASDSFLHISNNNGNIAGTSTAVYGITTLRGSQQTSLRCSALTHLHMVGSNQANYQTYVVSAYDNTPFAVRGMQWFASSGNIYSGIIKIYGYN